jgi:enoyl-CoA hydratase
MSSPAPQPLQTAQPLQTPQPLQPLQPPDPAPLDPASLNPTAAASVQVKAEPSGQAEVLVRREGVDGRLGRLTLNRPGAINALTTSMVGLLDDALREWADDPGVRAVVLDGAGTRGLCAGGDMRAVREAVLAGHPEQAREFWADEYRLNARIRRFPKPYIAIMDGIVMGGGIGVSAHGSVRIVTERSVLAMPEVGIGFTPDVGGTWLLGHDAPGELGTHLALTGGRIGAADAILAGLADHYLPAAAVPALLDTLRTAEDPARAIAAHDFTAHTPPPGRLAADRAWIDDLYRGDNLTRIIRLLTHSVKPAARDAAAEIAAKSPTSLAVTLRALRAAASMGSLEEALEQEYRMACAGLASPDLAEGVRAVIVDKDHAPRWSPARLADVTAADVDRYFAPVHPDLGLAATAVGAARGARSRPLG